MFLMCSVLTLQSTWEAFRPPGGFRVPAEGVGGAAVSAGVQMLIRSLRRGDPVALGPSHECGLQRRQGPEHQRDARPAPSLAEPKQGSVACGPASAGVHPASGEGAAGPGAPAPDSDSDDSVDRGIEEAIQEYLKARSRGPRPPANAHADPQCPPQPPRAAPCPPRPAHCPCGGPGGAWEPLGSASPGSASSEDSFEQSIRAEIEQFLREKQQLAAAAGAAVCADRKGASAELAARPALRAQKEPELTAAAKEFIFRKPPRLAKTPGQPRSLRSKVTPDAGPGSTRPTTCRSSELAQAKGGVRRVAGPGRRGRRAPSAAPVQEAPDSSSDDGIEEAIQLYQLEKRREAGGVPPGPPTPGPGLAASSALPESHRKAVAGAWKLPTGKAMDQVPAAPEPGPPARPLLDTRAGVASRREAGGPGPCRADVSTELLCAEAILDISKTILPAPTEGGERAPAASVASPPPRVPSGSDSGGGSSVDSDDSIEREIRTFLALKAQADTGPTATQGPHGQAGGLQDPPPTSLSLSLSPKRTRRAGGHRPALTTPRSTRETLKEGGQETTAQQGTASETPAREGEDRMEDRTAGPGDKLAVSDAPTSLSLGPRRPVEEDSSDDKSSSLDSDEDLDTAIKDLLRSKRKRRKGWGDPRAAPPLKVRLGAAPKVLYRLPGLQRPWKDAGPTLWPRRSPKSKQARGTLRAGAPGLLTQRIPEGPFFSGSREPQPPTPSPSSASEEDSGSVDSEDSIELEIRKFLAEKAKEAPGTGGSPRPELPCRKTLPPGVCTRSQRSQGATQAGRGTPRAELACPPAVPAPRSTQGSRRPVFAHRDQSPRVAEPAAADGTLGATPGCLAAAVPSEGPSACCPGPSAPSRGLVGDREAGAAAGLALPWADFAQQSQLQGLWALSPEGGGGAWQGGLSSRREKGAEGQARCLPSLAPDPKKSLPLAGLSPLLPTRLFHFGKSVSWGAKPAGLFSSPLSVPTHGPSFSAFRGAQAARAPVFGSSHALLKKEGGPWPPGRAQAGHGVRDARRVGPEQSAVGRPIQGEDDEPEASGTSDLSDSSLEEGGGGPLARGKVLEL